MEAAQRLNPEDAQRHTHLTFLARAYVSVGDYDAAIERARQAIRRRPDCALRAGNRLGPGGTTRKSRASLRKCDELSRDLSVPAETGGPTTMTPKKEKLREALRLAQG